MCKIQNVASAPFCNLAAPMYKLGNISYITEEYKYLNSMDWFPL